VREPARPVDTLAERLAAAADERTTAVLVSAVLFEDARIVPGLDALAGACAERGVELLVDAYHALGALPFAPPPSAWVVGGGYKYLQLGEGNCYLRLPAHAGELRPVLTGWYAEFDALAAAHAGPGVAFGGAASRFAGATYDPTSHYRAAAVLRFFREQGLTPGVLHASYRHQVALLADRFDALGLPDELVTRERGAGLDAFAGFLALRSPHARALAAELARRGVAVDHRASFLRLGPAPYLSDAQLERAMERLGEAATAVARTSGREGSRGRAR
jgi:kynureninase